LPSHDTPRVSSGYVESSCEKKYEKKKRAVVSKNLILAFVGITFLEKPHSAALHKIMLYKATSKYTMNLS
jgi:hypothetical protein